MAGPLADWWISTLQQLWRPDLVRRVDENNHLIDPNKPHWDNYWQALEGLRSPTTRPLTPAERELEQRTGAVYAAPATSLERTLGRLRALQQQYVALADRALRGRYVPSCLCHARLYWLVLCSCGAA
jgi:hypothetical protein